MDVLPRVRGRSGVQALAATSRGMSHRPRLHPDLAGIPAGHGELRLTLIRAHLDVASGTLLDMGANLGYFCHKLEDEGFTCFAVDQESSRVLLHGKVAPAAPSPGRPRRVSMVDGGC